MGRISQLSVVCHHTIIIIKIPIFFHLSFLEFFPFWLPLPSDTHNFALWGPEFVFIHFHLYLSELFHFNDSHQFHSHATTENISFFLKLSSFPLCMFMCFYTMLSFIVVVFCFFGGCGTSSSIYGLHLALSLGSLLAYLGDHMRRRDQT